MTFRESEFPNMVSQLDLISKNYPPDAVSRFIREMLRIYRAIPLYPGLVCMCMGKAFEKWDPKNPPPAKGTFVVIRSKGSAAFAGTILSWTPAAIQIEEKNAAGKTVKTKVPIRSVVGVERFRTDTLEAFWPTLVFDGKPDAARKAAR